MFLALLNGVKMTAINYDTPKNTFAFKTLNLSGNLIPFNLYKSIITKANRPDLPAISIFSEVLYWYRPKANNIDNSNTTFVNKFSGDAWQTSYSYLTKKFGFSHETIRRSLVKLETLGVIKREFRAIYLKGQIYNNVMFIHLGENIDKFLSATTSPKPVFLRPKREAPSPQGCGHHIYNKIKEIEYISRSNESNFIESNLEEGKGGKSLNDERSNITEHMKSNKIEISPAAATNLFDKVKAKFIGNKRKSIAELYPIIEEEVVRLQMTSGREFNLNYINKLVEKLGKQYPDHGFYTRELFLGYLSKALTNELRQESVVNNEVFKFKANDEETRKQNYLSKVEESRGTCRQSQLRKKIAASFDTDTSYKLVTSCIFRDKIQNNIFEVITSVSLDLTDNQHTILIDLVRSVYGNEAEHINFIISHSPKIDTPSEIPILNLGKEGSIWNKVSKKLLEHYGEGIHRSWFSKLEAEESKTQNRLILKAPTNFIGDWIKSNYLGKISEQLQYLGFDSRNIEVIA